MEIGQLLTQPFPSRYNEVQAPASCNKTKQLQDENQWVLLINSFKGDTHVSSHL
jgi:hypothetical protein